MGDCEPCPQRGAMAAIKDEKLLGMPVMERTHDATAQVFARPGRAKPLAFEAEERYFIERIDHSQPGIELQAIDDADRITETNVFGAQIAVAIDIVRL
jgi:hypothetical protein